MDQRVIRSLKCSYSKFFHDEIKKYERDKHSFIQKFKLGDAIQIFVSAWWMTRKVY